VTFLDVPLAAELLHLMSMSITRADLVRTG
jgi:hypothetical protein